MPKVAAGADQVSDSLLQFLGLGKPIVFFSAPGTLLIDPYLKETGLLPRRCQSDRTHFGGKSSEDFLGKPGCP